MHKGLKEPHLLLASSNPIKLMRNLVGILETAELDKIREVIDQNVVELFRLGEAHFNFATAIDKAEWRQRVSRLYYAAYNVRRALVLKHSGKFSTDIDDHNKIDDIPDSLKNVATYKITLKNLREDRNLADYSHMAAVTDLLVPVDDSERVVGDFITDVTQFLRDNGVTL